MKKEDVLKANNLLKRIDKLSLMKRDLRPQFCNGVAFERVAKWDRNESFHRYAYHLFAVTSDSREDDAIIMRAGIKAMYDTACQLLDESKKELESL